jgi:hypothetical protein
MLPQHPPGKAAADVGHMFRVIEKVQPKGIVCFGAVAAQGMQELHGSLYFQQLSEPMKFVPWHNFPHPNARHLPQSKIDEFAREIISRYF